MPLSPKTFRQLYEENDSFVWHTVRRFGVGIPSAEDAVQDTFITPYRKASSLANGWWPGLGAASVPVTFAAAGVAAVALAATSLAAPAVSKPMRVLPSIPEEAPRSPRMSPHPEQTPPPHPAPERLEQAAAATAATRPKRARHESVAPDLAEQTRRLLRGQRLVRQARPDEALQLLARHADDFPDSPHADLRTAVRIDALCDVGRTVEAKALADDLLLRAPRSPIVPRVRRSCAFEP